MVFALQQLLPLADPVRVGGGGVGVAAACHLGTIE
jgi:hypothetical protein